MKVSDLQKLPDSEIREQFKELIKVVEAAKKRGDVDAWAHYCLAINLLQQDCSHALRQDPVKFTDKKGYSFEAEICWDCRKRIPLF